MRCAPGSMKTLLVNFKNYPVILGEGSVSLATVVGSVAQSVGVEAIVAPPTPMLARVAASVGVKVYSQSVGSETGDKTTGAVIPESVKGAGGSGTILNHSESRRPISELRSLVPKLATAGLEVCLCAQTAAEAAELSRLTPDYLAIEPPELIGTGVAVSKARPELIEETVRAAGEAGYRGRVLCGAGIVDGEDVRKAVQLGADGVLVASSVVKASDWRAKLEELARSLT